MTRLSLYDAVGSYRALILRLTVVKEIWTPLNSKYIKSYRGIFTHKTPFLFAQFLSRSPVEINQTCKNRAESVCGGREHGSLLSNCERFFFCFWMKVVWSVKARGPWCREYAHLMCLKWKAERAEEMEAGMCCLTFSGELFCHGNRRKRRFVMNMSKKTANSRDNLEA